ncbi:hypothetical protein OROGR_004729 [Orobanche gracilis]
MVLKGLSGGGSDCLRRLVAGDGGVLTATIGLPRRRCRRCLGL